MPYAVLPAVNGDTRRALARACWDALVASRPDLQPAVDLQRRLLDVVLRLTDELEAVGAQKLSLPPGYLTKKLEAGIPALTAEPVPVPVQRLREPLLELCRVLATHGGAAAQQLADVAGEGRLDVGALMGLAMRREQATIRTVATKAGLGHDLLWLVADLAAGPFAHVLRASLFDRCPADSPLHAALDGWTRGQCPLCGSWPGFAELLGGRRVLRCGFCAAAWEQSGEPCVYCSASGAALWSTAPDPDRPGRRVETCTGCRGYLKAIATETLMPFPLLPLRDLESMDLDMSAIQRGFARPVNRPLGTKR